MPSTIFFCFSMISPWHHTFLFKYCLVLCSIPVQLLMSKQIYFIVIVIVIVVVILFQLNG